MPSVTVNLNINVNAQTDVEVFGQTPTPPTQDIIIADIKLPASTFYISSGNSLIEFQGQGDNIVGSKGQFSTSEATMATSINNIINGLIDGTTAFPFSESMYSSTAAYKQYPTFGNLALASYAHSLTGHVAATAAITNDNAIINHFNGNTSPYAEIANQIADQIKNMDTTKCTNIVKQVLGQDASRAKLVDNDNTTPDLKQALEFKNGDIVYFGITLQKPTSVTAGTGQEYPISNTLFTDRTYYVKCMIGSGSGAIAEISGGGGGGGGSSGGGSSGGGSSGGGSGGGGSTTSISQGTITVNSATLEPLNGSIALSWDTNSQSAISVALLDTSGNFRTVSSDYALGINATIANMDMANFLSATQFSGGSVTLRSKGIAGPVPFTDLGANDSYSLYVLPVTNFLANQSITAQQIATSGYTKIDVNGGSQVSYTNTWVVGNPNTSTITINGITTTFTTTDGYNSSFYWSDPFTTSKKLAFTLSTIEDSVFAVTFGADAASLQSASVMARVILSIQSGLPQGNVVFRLSGIYNTTPLSISTGSPVYLEIDVPNKLVNLTQGGSTIGSIDISSEIGSDTYFNFIYTPGNDTNNTTRSFTNIAITNL